MMESSNIEMTDDRRPPPSIAETEEMSVNRESSMDIEQSMPTPAELTGKRDNEDLEQSHRRGKAIMYACIVAPFLLIAIIVGAVVQTQRNNESRTTDPNNLRNMDNSESFQAVANYLGTHDVSQFSDIIQTGTPQNVAATYLAHRDEHPRSVPDGSPSTAEGYEFITRYILAVLYYQTGGAGWKNNLNFLQGEQTCDWYRIIVTDNWQLPMGALCNSKGEIEQLVMIGMNAKGRFPTELGHLTTLRVLEMDVNQIEGSLPNEFSKLENLSNLHLSHNKLTGQLPSYLGNFQSLVSIDVSFNALEGAIPVGIADLPFLKGMALDYNLLTGQVPYWDPTRLENGKKQESLEFLFLENNNFEGTLLQSAFQSIPSMKVLDISDNGFSGSIPVSAFQMSTLVVLDLHDNEFSGELPTNILKNEALQFLALQNNQLTGKIKDTISNIRSLKHLDVSGNQLTGVQISDSDPDEDFGLPALRNLVYLYLADNNFPAGPIPDYIQRMTKLEELNLKSLSLDGTIPTWMGELTNLVLLDLDNNDLRGTVPSELGQLSQLQFLLLNRNELTEQVPTELGSLPYLRLVYLDTNALTGDASAICEGQRAPGIPTPIMVADCAGIEPEFKCDCCHKCCAAEGACNHDDVVPSNDPMWQFGYDRVFYSFGNMTGYFVAVESPPS